MARYGQALKDRAVARLLPPETAQPDSSVARSIGEDLTTVIHLYYTCTTPENYTCFTD